MNLDDARLGYAFEGDYPEVYGRELPRLRELLAHQLDQLGKEDGVRDAAALGVLRGRRCSQRDLAQIEVDRNAPMALAARREIIVRADKWCAPDVERAFRLEGFDDRGKRYGSFVRLWNSQTGRNPGPDACRKAGVQGWPNAIATMAAVGKGIGGPDPVASPLAKASRNFEKYAVPDRQWRGAPQVVAVLDTGIPGKYEDGLPTMNRTDGWLDNIPRSDSNRDFLDCLPQRDGYLDFQAGHCTFVAGIVQRVAPTAEIRVYRAADTDGFADDVGIAEVLWQAVEEGARIVNLSLGMVTGSDQPPPALKDTVDRITRTYGDEVVIVAAAGNFGAGTQCWPAAFDEVETVGALIETEKVANSTVAPLSGHFEPAPWSSSRAHVDFWTVAEGVRSTFVTGYESPLFDETPEVFPHNAWALWSGTSFAAPQIAGAVARICHVLGLKPRDAVDLLKARGAPVDKEEGRAMRILSGIPRKQARANLHASG